MGVWKSHDKEQWRFEFVRKGRRFQSRWFPTQQEAKRAEKKALGRLEEISTDFTALCIARRSELDSRYHNRQGRTEHLGKNILLIEKLIERWKRKNEIAKADIQEFLDEEALVSPNRHNKTLRLIRALFNTGIRRELILKNPTKGIQMLPVQAPNRYVPEYEDIQKVLAVATEEQRLYLTVVITTMGRITAVNRLKWEDVYEDHLILRTRKARNSDEKKIQIPINQTLKEVLNSIPKTSEYVFLNKKTGKPYDYRNELMGRLCRKAGVKHFTYHALRHHGASRLIQSNVPLSVVQQLLGHERITTTAIYIRALGDDIKEAVKKLEVQ